MRSQLTPHLKLFALGAVLDSESGFFCGLVVVEDHVVWEVHGHFA